MAVLVGRSETEARLLVPFTAPLPVFDDMGRPRCLASHCLALV